MEALKEKKENENIIHDTLQEFNNILFINDRDEKYKRLMRLQAKIAGNKYSLFTLVNEFDYSNDKVTSMYDKLNKIQNEVVNEKDSLFNNVNVKLLCIIK